MKPNTVIKSQHDKHQLDSWHSKWQENQIGWHESQVHKAFVKYGQHIVPGGLIFKNTIDKQNDSDESMERTFSSTTQNENKTVHTASSTQRSSMPPAVRVFFPLCGKSVDMAFLAQQESVQGVVGVDGIRKALDTFADEYPQLEIHEEEKASEPTTAAEEEDVESNNSSRNYERLVGKKITLIKGDFLELDDSITDGRFEAVFDRGSLVAIDPILRKDYVTTIGKLIQPGGKILLVSIERLTGTHADKNGPPFSLPETQVRLLYEAQEWVESVTLLEAEDGIGRDMRSLFFLIQAKQQGTSSSRKRKLSQ